MKPKSIILFTIVIGLLVAANEILLDKTYIEKPDSNAAVQVIKQTTTTDENAAQLIGGKFMLTDHNGNKFTESELVGKYSLVYFGFTHCPFICPTALSNMSLALNELGADADKVQILFITADPKRDNPARMKEFLESFNAPIIGLTGSEDELAQAATAYKVYAEKLAADSTGNYDMNHTSIIYLMDKDGRFTSHFSHETKVADIIAGLKQAIK